PSQSAALRMSNQDRGPQLVEESGGRIHVRTRIIGTSVRRHLAEELFERCRIFRELDIGIELRPNAETEDPIPELFIRLRGQVQWLSAARCAAAARLVHEIHRVIAAE